MLRKSPNWLVWSMNCLDDYNNDLCLILPVTMTLNFQGQILKSAHLQNGWCNQHKYMYRYIENNTSHGFESLFADNIYHMFVTHDHTTNKCHVTWKHQWETCLHRVVRCNHCHVTWKHQWETCLHSGVVQSGWRMHSVMECVWNFTDDIFANKT